MKYIKILFLILAVSSQINGFSDNFSELTKNYSNNKATNIVDKFFGEKDIKYREALKNLINAICEIDSENKFEEILKNTPPLFEYEKKHLIRCLTEKCENKIDQQLSIKPFAYSICAVTLSICTIVIALTKVNNKYINRSQLIMTALAIFCAYQVNTELPKNKAIQAKFDSISEKMVYLIKNHPTQE